MSNKNAFDKFIDWLNDVENSFVNLISKVIPILVPLIPAYVSYNHVKNELGFSDFFAFTYAAVVEGLGYASIYKALQFWEWNRRFSKEEKKSPFTLAIIIYITYIFVILWVNVMLDWQTGVVWYRIVAVGAISLLSVPAGLLVSISAMHNERVREHNERLEQLKEARDEAKRLKEENRVYGGGGITNAQPRQQTVSETKPEKKKKSEVAYDYVAQYYAETSQLPTNKTVSENTGVSIGTSHEAINRFVADNAEELISKGLVTQEHIDKITGSVANNSTNETLHRFVSSNNRFPTAEELSGMGVSLRDAARYVSENSDMLLNSGLVDEQTIEQARAMI